MGLSDARTHLQTKKTAPTLMEPSDSVAAGACVTCTQKRTPKRTHAHKRARAHFCARSREKLKSTRSCSITGITCLCCPAITYSTRCARGPQVLMYLLGPRLFDYFPFHLFFSPPAPLPNRRTLIMALRVATAVTFSCADAPTHHARRARTAGQPIPAATQNMVTRAESKRPKPTGASGPKKVVPRIASATVDGGSVSTG